MAIKCPKCQSENPDDTIYCGKCGSPLKSVEAISVTKTSIPLTVKLQKGSMFAGRYNIIEELGRGGMGIVYKAEDTKLKRAVALKFLPHELTHIPEVHDRFMREAQAAAALDHPNICTVYEFDEAEEKAFISMAFIEGQSLKKKIETGPVDLEKALKIAEQVAEGLQEAHKKGIVHRDIKSSNIMVTGKGQAKIMDFGLARVAESTQLTKEGSTMGTVAYMSPEQAKGKEVGHRTDIWSFGVVLYELLTGQLPFQGENEQSVIYSILREKPRPITEFLTGIPESIEQVVIKALEKNPDNRYSQIDELIDDLKSISAGIVPEEIKARVRKAKLRKRKRVILSVGAAALVILVVTLALTLFTGPAEAIDSIAVLPLENLTGDANQEYFAVGSTDELIGQLGQISGLRRVISRTSVMRYKETDLSLSDIARELNVDAVVEGSIYQVGEKVRIKVQLFDALPEERNLWTQTYEWSMNDVLLMYGEIARTIAEETHINLTEEEAERLRNKRQVDPEAFAACIRGMSHWYKLTPPDFDVAQQYFETALEIDPDYALANAGMFLTLAVRAQMGLVPSLDVTPKAKPYLTKALELDDTLPEAHFAHACMKTWFEWDYAGGEASFLRAIELNPNYAVARVYYSNLLCYMGRFDEALEQGKQAVEQDPLNSVIKGIYGNTLFYVGKYDEAVEQALNTLKTSPHDPVAHISLWMVYHMRGHYEDALAEAKASFVGLGAAPIADVMSKGNEEGGYVGAMSMAAETIKAIFQETYMSPCFIANLSFTAGDKEQTLEWLEKGFELRDPNMPYMGDGTYGSLVGDEPRFQDLLRKMNLPVDDKE